MFVFFTECAEKLFDLVDGFAESTKRKAAVWPLQIILLILCPEIIQDISKDVVDESNINKVRRETSGCHLLMGAACLFKVYILVMSMLGQTVGCP
jgi:hypothetical protein